MCLCVCMRMFMHIQECSQSVVAWCSAMFFFQPWVSRTVQRAADCVNFIVFVAFNAVLAE